MLRLGQPVGGHRMHSGNISGLHGKVVSTNRENSLLIVVFHSVWQLQCRHD